MARWRRNNGSQTDSYPSGFPVSTRNALTDDLLRFWVDRRWAHPSTLAGVVMCGVVWTVWLPSYAVPWYPSVQANKSNCRWEKGARQTHCLDGPEPEKGHNDNSPTINSRTNRQKDSRIERHRTGRSASS
ncbi:hypothetical protein LY76DRAFT_594047, partial [Colletotrichum caudatum]